MATSSQNIITHFSVEDFERIGIPDSKSWSENEKRQAVTNIEAGIEIYKELVWKPFK